MVKFIVQKSKKIYCEIFAKNPEFRGSYFLGAKYHQNARKYFKKGKFCHDILVVFCKKNLRAKKIR